MKWAYMPLWSLWLPTQLCDADCTGQFLCKEMLKGLPLFVYIFEKDFQLIFLC